MNREPREIREKMTSRRRTTEWKHFTQQVNGRVTQSFCAFACFEYFAVQIAAGNSNSISVADIYAWPCSRPLLSQASTASGKVEPAGTVSSPVSACSKIIILDKNLKQLASYTVAGNKKTSAGLSAAIVDLKHDRSRQIVALADTVQILEFTPGRK